MSRLVAKFGKTELDARAARATAVEAGETPEAPPDPRAAVCQAIRGNAAM